MRVIRTVTLLALVLALAACGDDDTPTGPDPTPPATFTENYSGTLNQNGGRTHNFNTQASGTVTATLVTVSPDSELLIGLSLGTWNGNACQVVIAKDDAKAGTILTGAVSALGSLCVRIYDVGNITAAQPIDYEIQVVHP
jgi:hypothetical protein